MSYNAELQSNNAELEEILNAINELPESGSVSDAVRYVPQNLTEAQQAQARQNIGITGTGADGKDGVSATHSWNGTVLTVTSASGTSSADLKGADGKDGKTAYQYAQDGGYVGTEAEYAAKLATPFATPQMYGAKGNGSTDDTAAFQSALASNRVLYVPGGIYKLSGGLIIRENCELELSQDAVLEFTQTSGNCISMKYSANIRGHHATVRVPYKFSGNVIYVSSTLDTNVLDTPPFVKWDPQWKSGRYITDLNIVMPETRGFHYCMNPGECSGTAVYISADGNRSTSSQSVFIWGLNFSGLRIAGAFAYGIRAKNINEGWNHEMHIEAFLDACEIGVSLEDCNNAYVSAVIQARAGLTSAQESFVYAKHGIQLIRSRNTSLYGSRVWDWDASHCLWQRDNEYQHIAMYGDCRGTILDDFLYYSTSTDIRELIHTDTPSNLEKITILQEPFTRWFKPKDNMPYFSNGIDDDQRLLLKSEQDALFQTREVENFTNQLALATDENGAVYNGVGYKAGVAINGANGSYIDAYYIVSTGYMPCTQTSVIRFSGMKFSTEGYCGMHVYNAQKEPINFLSGKNIITTSSVFFGYAETEDGFEITVKNVSQNAGTAFFRLCTRVECIGTKPVVAVDEEISYVQVGFLSDGINMSYENVVGLGDHYVGINRRVLDISSASTDEQYPTAKAVYGFVSELMGEYVDTVDALIGGGS